MYKNIVYYILDEKNEVYFFAYKGFMSKFFRDLEFGILKKKYPSKKFYKLSADILSLLESYEIDYDFWCENDE